MKFQFDSKNLSYRFFFVFIISFTVSFNVVILFKTVYYFKHQFELKIDLKTCTFENLEEIFQKPFANL